MTTEDGERSQLITSDTVITLAGLDPYKSYYFSLAAENIAGQGPFSSSVAIRTGEAGTYVIYFWPCRFRSRMHFSLLTDPTASPSNLTISEVGSTYVELMWNAPHSSEHNGIIRFYIVIVSEVETNTNFSLSSSSTQTTVTNLHPFYLYYFTVAAVTIGSGPFSDQQSIRTLEDGMLIRICGDLS